MVGVPADGVGEDHHPGPEVPDLLHHHAPGLVGVGQRRVGQPRVPALRHPQHLRRRRRLPGPELGAAPRPGLAAGEVQDAGGMPGIPRLEQRPGAGQFDVVTVRGDGQQGDGVVCV